MSSAISDQSSECSDALSAQISSKFAGSRVELGVGGVEAGAGDVGFWIAELELELAPRQNEADSYKGLVLRRIALMEFHVEDQGKKVGE